MMLVHHLRVNVGFVKLEENILHLSFKNSSPKGLREDISSTLSDLTKTRWNVISSDESCDDSIKKQELDLLNKIESDIRNNPLVKEALSAFDGAEIEKIEINKKVI